ncbi:MAG: signal peptidase II [Oscillospiraceae bacterium]|nr:signal peptidase II [Candidatus Ruminococcus equi]
MLALYIGIAILVALIDQVIKCFVVAYLKPVSTVTAIPYILNLSYVENKGVAFGMFSNMRIVFIIVTSIVIVLFAYLLTKNYKKSKLFSVSAALIIGGGLGNLIDRIFVGYVVDYLALTFFPPVCNFADYAITAGTVLLIIYLIFYADKDKRKLKNE